MIRKLSEIFKDKKRTYSFEFFPPKTRSGLKKLYETAGALKVLDPDFFSVTYGAGGGTRDLTMEIACELQKRFEIPAVHHLTCIGHSRGDLSGMIEKMRQENIKNILALRGDPPADDYNYKPAHDGLEYAYQLCELIRSYDDFFCPGVAGFPGWHIDCPDLDTDSGYLKKKIDSGGEFVITQLFFDNREYFDYVERIREMGVNVRVIPGILPVTNYRRLLKFCEKCGAEIPREVHDIFKPLDGDADATVEAGVEFAAAQCGELLEGGAPGLHFFTLNRFKPAAEILKRIER